MTASSTRVLLDTCAVIWLANSDPLSSEASRAIGQAGLAEGVLVSPISAWEIGLLSRPKQGGRDSLEFRPDPKTWFSRFMASSVMRLAVITPDIAIEASHLPGDLHSDPADRLIIATARSLGATIITRDPKILAYAEAGFVEAIAC